MGTYDVTAHARDGRERLAHRGGDRRLEREGLFWLGARSDHVRSRHRPNGHVDRRLHQPLARRIHVQPSTLGKGSLKVFLVMVPQPDQDDRHNRLRVMGDIDKKQ